MGIVIRHSVVWRILFALSALCRSNVSADDPVSALSATPFRLNERLIAQARRAAAIELAKPRAVKRCRPQGLESLETPEEIANAVRSAAAMLHSDDAVERMRGYAQLRYLGDDAFESLVDDARGQNPDAAEICIELLGQRGRKAIPTLVKLLNSASDREAEIAQWSLFRLGDPACIPPLIDELQTARERQNTTRQDRISKALWYYHDKRARAALRELGQAYLSQMKRQAYLEPCVATRSRRPEWFDQHYWPENLLEVQQLCRDAVTRKGETFGVAELQQIRAELTFPQPVVMTGDICMAFMSFGDPVVVPDIIRFCRQEVELRRQLMADQAPKRDVVRVSFQFFPVSTDEQQRIRSQQLSRLGSARFWLYWTLAELPTPEAVDFVIERIEGTDHDERRSVLTSMKSRWTVPLLIACLDDREMLQWWPFQRRRAAQVRPVVRVPFSHAIYSNLQQLLTRCGLPGKTVILPKGQEQDVTIDIRPELERIKRWWARYGDEFLAGETVPDPELTSFERR